MPEWLRQYRARGQTPKILACCTAFWVCQFSLGMQGRNFATVTRCGRFYWARFSHIPLFRRSKVIIPHQVKQMPGGLRWKNKVNKTEFTSYCTALFFLKSMSDCSRNGASRLSTSLVKWKTMSYEIGAHDEWHARYAPWGRGVFYKMQWKFSSDFRVNISPNFYRNNIFQQGKTHLKFYS